MGKKRSQASHRPPPQAAPRPPRQEPPAAGLLLRQAVALHQAGDLAGAKAQYQKVLKLAPRNADALNLWGLALYQGGDHGQAAEKLSRAVRLNGGVAEYHSNLGMTWRALGHHGRAVAAYARALALSPATAGLHFNLGNALKDQGRLDEAAAAYRRALELDPAYPEALNSLGVVAKSQGRPEEAAELHRRALALRPDYPEALGNLGNVLLETGHPEEAAQCLRRAAALGPGQHSHHYNLSSALIGLGRFAEAEASARRALELKPDHAESVNNLGVALNSLGRVEQAIAEYQRALALQPDYAEGHSNLSMALTSRGRLRQAEASARRALELRPDFVEAHNNLANALKDSGRLAEAFAHYRRAVEIKPDYASAHSNLLMCLNYDPGMDEAGLLAAHRAWDQQHGRPDPPPPAPRREPDPERRLRLGYVSADLYRHTVAYYLLPVLTAHDRRAFEIFCYSARDVEDDMTARLRAQAGAWRSLVGQGDRQAARLIAGDAIDILIDLSGHTAHNRLGVFAHRPAPVQASWLGYFNTTGMAAMDYILMDPHTVPPGQERWFTEEVARLPHGRFCYQAPEYAPAVAPPPCLSRGRTTFGSFNNLTKLSGEVAALWARVLHAVEGSRLVLKWKTLADPEERRRLEDLFAGQGLDPARLDLRGPTPHPQMLAEYGDIDVGLDPFPFSGGVTSCEALWMGVPVVTWPRRRPVSRQTLGFLAALGLEELAADGPEDYLRQAVALAGDRQRLARLRSGLRPAMAASPLCDAPRFAAALEDLLRGLWRGWCLGRPARDPGA